MSANAGAGHEGAISVVNEGDTVLQEVRLGEANWIFLCPKTIKRQLLTQDTDWDNIPHAPQPNIGNCWQRSPRDASISASGTSKLWLSVTSRTLRTTREVQRD